MFDKFNLLCTIDKVLATKVLSPKLMVNAKKNFLISQATRCCVLVSHSSCIWDIKNLCCENMHDPSLACVARGCSGGISFATCSADGTIRLWDLALQSDLPRDAAELCSTKAELMSSSCLGNITNSLIFCLGSHDRDYTSSLYSAHILLLSCILLQ